MENTDLKKIFNAKMLLGNIGAIGGLYYAYNKKSNFGILLLTSILGSIVGSYIGSKIDEKSAENETPIVAVESTEEVSDGKTSPKLDLSVENENMESQMRNFL
jgi:hypothetical protein